MMIIRPVRQQDLPAIRQLATKTGVGVTSLPPDEAHLQARIQRVLATWADEAIPAEQGYLFVLEDTQTGQVVGISGLEAAVGLSDPWYHYRLGTLVHASRDLAIYNQMPTLFLSNDYTGCSELCTLFLDPDYRHSKNGQLLSKCRFLFMAAFRERFATKVIAEMRGYSDEQGKSPFWEGLGRHFFAIDFAEADRLTGLGQKAFIAELMPKHPLYVDFLPAETQAILGQVHPQTAPARAILESEGLKYEGYVDIFDAGPTLEAYLADIRAVRDSRVHPVQLGEPSQSGPLYLLANDRFTEFRALLSQVAFADDSLILDPATAAALEIGPGDQVRAVPLFAPQSAAPARPAATH